MPRDPRDHAGEQFCYLTTTGRVTGRPHEIENWFAYPPNPGRTLYMMAGGRDRADWVRNLRADPRVGVRLGGESREGRARILDPGTDEDRLARRLLVEKYEPIEGGSLADWGRTSLPVAVEFTEPG